MKWITHQATAVAAALALHLPLGGVAAACAGAVLPDVLDQRMAGLAPTRRGQQKIFNAIHRGTTHWFGWWLAVCVAALVLLPLSVLLLSWQSIDAQIWSHLWDTQMPRLLGNTLTLIVGVGIGVTLLGVSLAWLTSLCEFPGRRWLDWALMLPFAIPAYVLAFVFVGLLDFAGPIQTLLREWFGMGLRLPRVRSTGGVITVLILVFYPYVYLLARTAFLAQGKGLMEAARVLGQSPWQAFWRVALPMARPAIGAGVALALMETLADFGAVSVFNFDTFTTAIYKTWYGFFSLSTAYLINLFTAGDACLYDGTASPSVILDGGSTGIFTISQFHFSVIRLFITLIPSPFSIIAIVAKFSRVVK